MSFSGKLGTALGNLKLGFWSPQSLSYGFGQAQAKINAFGTQQYGQCQADIKQTYQAYGQAQTYIKLRVQASGQAQATIIQIPTFQGSAFQPDAFQVDDTRSQTFTGKLGSSLSKLGSIKLGSLGDHVAGTSSTTSNAFGQAQAWIKATYKVFGQSQGDIKQVYQGYGQAQADTKQTYLAFAQSQADIKIIGYGFGQSNASILGPLQQFGQSQADIKQTYQQYAQSQADIKATSQAYGQSQSRIILIVRSFGQSNADILVTVFRSAQANADILATTSKFAQTQAQISIRSFRSGQAQARISSSDTPEGYWRLDDQQGLVAHAVIGPDGAYRPSGTTFRVPTPMPHDGVNFGVSAIGPADVTFPVLDVTNNFSFEIWVKPSVDINLVTEDITGIIDGPQNYAWFVSQRGSDRGAGVSVGKNGIQVIVNGDNALYALASYVGTLPTHINHVAVTFTNKQPKIYLNGVLVRTGLTETANFVYRPSRLFGNSYSGIATNASLYNKTLSDAQVLDHYNAGIPKGHGQARAYVNPAGVVFSNVTSLIDSPIKVQSATVQADILRTFVGCAQTQAVIESRYARRVIDDGATHFWKLNETTGYSAYDSIPVVPKTGTYTGTLISVDGPPRIGDARGVEFLGGDTNNYISFPDATDMPTGSMDRTIELWYRSSTNLPQTLFGYGSDSSEQLFLIDIFPTTVFVGLFNDDHNFTLNVPPFDGMWHTIVVTYSNRRLEVFFDAISLGVHTTFSNAHTTTQQFTLAERNGNDAPIYGDIALVSTYQKVLTNTQIVDHALGESRARMGQAQARILSFGQTVFRGQAQAYIGHLQSGQAQAFIGHKQFAQAQAKIFYGATQVFAQAQAKIGTIRGYGQATALLTSGHKQANGQAQGYIRSFKQKLFAQSNALITPTPKTWGLAQALIFNGVWYGQAATLIRTTEPSKSANARAKIHHPPTGQAAALIVVQKFRSAQAQADIKSVNNRFGNAQAQITNMQGFGQAITKIWSNVDNPALGLAQSYIGLRATGCGQARARIVPASVDMVFTDHLSDAHTYVLDGSVSVAPIDMSLYSVDTNDPDANYADNPQHPANGSWINSFGSSAPNGWLRFVLNTRSTFHIDSLEFLDRNHDTIINIYTGTSTYGSWTTVAFNDDAPLLNTFESSLDTSLDAGTYILQVGSYNGSTPSLVHWNISATTIIPVPQFGQAMASIFRVVGGLAVAKIWSNVDNPALGLAQAYIANNKVFGQAVACIRKTYFYDFFDRTTSAGNIGVSTDGTATYTTGSSLLFVDGSELVISDSENFTDVRGYPVFAEAVYQFDFETPNTTADFRDFNSYVEFDNGNWPVGGTNADDFVYFSSNGDNAGVGTKDTFIEISLKPATWYTVKAFLAGSIGRTVYVKAWERGTPEPEWMAYNKVTSTSIAFNAALWIGGPRFSTGNAYLDNLLIYSDGIVPQFQSAQAQALIRRPTAIGQAQALLRRSEGYGNANAKIILVRRGFGQAQARIPFPTAGYGQAQTLLITMYHFPAGQTQAMIISGNAVGQAQAQMFAFPIVTGQAQAKVVYIRQVVGNTQGMIILTYQRMAQAKARIIQSYTGSGQALAQIGHMHSGQANARIRSFNVPQFGLAAAYIYDGTVIPNPGGGGAIAVGGKYIVKFNGFDLPGYAQSETMDSQLRIERKYSLTESQGLGNKNVDIKMRLFEKDYITVKSKLEYAFTILRSKRREVARLYIQRLDRYYLAMTTKINYSKSVNDIGLILDYDVEWEAKPWLTGNNTFTLQGSGDLDTDSVGRTLYDGGWTPARVTITGTDVTISGYTDTGDFAGYIAVNGSVTNLVIDTENYTATINGVNANQYLADYEYGIYIGPGKTNFTVTGASSVQIKYENRWYL